MRTIVWFLALVINAAVAALFAPVVLNVHVLLVSRLAIAGVVSVLLAICALLVAVRLRRAPQWGSQTMRWLCAAGPMLWLLGSLDTGRVSGLELWSVLLMTLLAWGSWNAFKLNQP